MIIRKIKKNKKISCSKILPNFIYESFEDILHFCEDYKVFNIEIRHFWNSAFLLRSRSAVSPSNLEICKRAFSILCE